MNKENLYTIFKNSECLSEEKLIAYCNNELTNLERNEVERHTINCKFCSDALEGFEKKIHTAKGYDSVKAAIHKKEKKNKSFIITITGIAVACLAFVLLINEFDENQVEVAENKSERKKQQDPKPESYKLEPKLGDRNDLNHRKDLNDTVIHIEQNGASRCTSDSSLTISPEVLSSNFKSEASKSDLIEKDNQNLVVEDVFEDEEVSYSVSDEGNQITYNWETEINEANKPEEQISKSKSIEFKKENEVNHFLVAEDKTSDKYFQDDLDKDESQLKKDTSFYRNSLNYANITEQSPNNVTETNKSTISERKGIIGLSDAYEGSYSFTDSISFSGTPLDSLGKDKEFDLGLSTYKKKSYAEAIRIFEKIKQANTRYYEAQLYIGISHIRLGNNEKAKAYLQNALNGTNLVKSEAQKILSTLK